MLSGDEKWAAFEAALNQCTARPVRCGLVWLALLGPLSFAVLVASLHGLRSDYNPLTRFVSEYAVGPFGFLMVAAFVALAIGSFALLGLLWPVLPATKQARGGIALLLVWAIGVLLAGLFPTDLQGTARTTTGLVHDGAALTALLCFSPAALLLARSLRQQPGWDRLGQWSERLAWCTFAGWIGWVGFGALNMAGLGQRVLLSGILVWLLVTAWTVGYGLRAISTTIDPREEVSAYEQYEQR